MHFHSFIQTGVRVMREISRLTCTDWSGCRTRWGRAATEARRVKRVMSTTHLHCLGVAAVRPSSTPRCST